MTDRKPPRRHTLAYEILGLIGISGAAAGGLFVILTQLAATIAEYYCFHSNVEMTEFDWLEVDRWIFSVGGIISVLVFSVLFLALLGDRMRYIRTLTGGIEALRTGKSFAPIRLEGNNELTELADAINYMAATQQILRERELALARQKEQFIRTLSHDIRTPLTSILAYTEYLAETEELPFPERKKHLQMMKKKAEQIRDLTGLLLDGDDRAPERFDNLHLLFAQLAAEFEEELEDRFTVQTDLSGCLSAAGALDVREMQRIFDNLCSNVQKYADPDAPVYLTVQMTGEGLRILQTNRIRSGERRESGYQLGIHSIRRIAQYYGGQVLVQQEGDSFSIGITLKDLQQKL